MKNIIIIILSLILCNSAETQKVIKPVCDESVNWDYNFNYSGFIIEDADVSPLQQVLSREIQISISDANNPTSTDFLESHPITLDRTGYFNVEIGSVNRNGFLNFINAMNDKENADYVMEVSLKDQNSTQLIGSKKILTVPYALVSNSLGGLGRQGQQGPMGPSGPQGPQGAQGNQGSPGLEPPNGLNGRDGFGIMIMTNTPPSGEKFYVDDGTNTADGEPHIRYNNNGIWIDL